MAPTLTAGCPARAATRLARFNAAPARGLRAAGRRALQVVDSVQFDYPTKVFQKELVKFADTEEYIYRQAGAPLGNCMRPHRACRTLWGFRSSGSGARAGAPRRHPRLPVVCERQLCCAGPRWLWNRL